MNKEVNKFLNLYTELRDYQKEGVRFLIERDHAFLADEMGLGKTVQTAVALEILKRTNFSIRILVICPASLCINWESELNKWSPKITVRRVIGKKEDRIAYLKLPFNLWILSYEQARNDISLIRRIRTYDLIVLDEVQKIKNPDSWISLACRKLPRLRSWVLTGTPIENKIEDLISIFIFLKSGHLHSAMTKKDIHKRMSSYFLRRRKEDVLKELPPINIQDLKLEMEYKQREVYDDETYGIADDFKKKRGKFSNIEILTMITKLKQICNYEPISGESCKLNALKSIIDGLNGTNYKIIIFSQFVKSLNYIKDKINIDWCEIYHGGLTKENREKVVRKFQNSEGPIVLLISLKAGGLGLNLQNASLVILFDRWWNPAVEDQAIQRAHRYGRVSSLHVIRFLVIDSIEERINQILEEKKNIFNEYVEKAEIAQTSIFSRQDLMRILGISTNIALFLKREEK